VTGSLRARERVVFASRRQLHNVLGLVSEEHRLERMVGPPGVWKESQTFQLQFLQQMGLSIEDTVLDVGCGPLRGGIVLIEYLGPGQYVGIDVRPETIAEARRQIAKRGLAAKEPEVFVSSSFGRDELEDRCFDAIWAFQLLYHLEDRLVDDYLAQVACRLEPAGAAYANVNPQLPPGRWKEFPYLQRPIEFYQDAGRRHELDVEALGELRDFGYTTKVAGHHNQMLRITHTR
jgi:SAM-dependent methyltransferase